MKLFQNIYLPVTILLLLFTSCIKDVTDTANYHYGKLSIKQIPMPDATTLDIYIDGKLYDSVLTNGNYTVLPLQAERSLTVDIYRKGTKELIADTAVTIPNDGNVLIRVVNSASFGLSGFYQLETVHPDSVRLQIIGNWNTTVYPYSKLNMEIYNYVSNKVGSLVTVLEGLEVGKMYPQPISLYHLNEGKTSGIQYIFKLWDPVSQQYIKQKSTNATEIFLLIGAAISYNGAVSIIQITDSGEAPTANRISAKLNIVY